MILIRLFLCRFRQEQEAILRKKEEERREQLAEKAKTRESYREKMSNVMRIDVSSIDYVMFFFRSDAAS